MRSLRPEGKLQIAAAAGSAALGLLALLRFMDFESPLLYLMVPLAPLAMAAGVAVTLALRSWRAAAAWTALALVGLAIALPGSTFPRTRCSITKSQDGLHIYSHNVSWEQGDPMAAARQIEATDADVVLLQEADAAFVSAVQDLLGERYPHETASASDKTLSLAVLSQWPLDEIEDTAQDSTEMNPFLGVTVRADSGPVRIVNLHLSAPRSGELQERRRNEYAHLADLTESTQIFAGDFNSSHSHAEFRRLVDLVGVDAHRAAGCGTGTTWSVLGAGPGLLALDHVLTGDGVSPAAHQIHGYAGSDHRAVSIRLTVTPG